VSHPIQLFINSSKFSLFIGTAIFAFEGIGLIIPIQDSMRHPEKFPLVLGLVLITITVLMVSVATIGYLSYGEDIKTAILLNLPQGNILVQSIQFFYSLAILLSTPLQLFPAIAIIQTYVFKLNASSSSSSLDTATSMMAPPPLPLSGKSNPRVKWSKNLLRATMVIICINIAWFGADDLDKFVSFVGCFACIPLVYLYPPLLHLKSVIDGKKLRLERDATSNDEFFEHDEEDDDEEESNARYWRAWIIDGGLVVIGVISMVYNSYQIMFG
jgi:proton-coupled amino acid transporter